MNKYEIMAITIEIFICFVDIVIVLAAKFKLNKRFWIVMTVPVVILGILVFIV